MFTAEVAELAKYKHIRTAKEVSSRSWAADVVNERRAVAKFLQMMLSCVESWVELGSNRQARCPTSAKDTDLPTPILALRSKHDAKETRCSYGHDGT